MNVRRSLRGVGFSAVAVTAGLAAWISAARPVQAGPTYADTILADNPVGFWQFEEANTGQPAADSAPAGGAQDGAYQGTASLVPGGIVGQAVNVDPAASGGEVYAAGVPMTASFSAETWAKSDTSTWNAYGWMPDERGANGFLLHPDMGGTSWRGFIVNNTGGFEQIGSSTVPNIQQWHYYALTYDDGTHVGRMYRDGSLVAQKTGTTSVRDASSTVNVDMGRDDGMTGFDRKGDGSLDEVAVYNANLTADQVWEHYARGAVPQMLDAGAWKFEGAGDLDLQGQFVYAVDVGDTSGSTVATIGDATFTGEAVAGVSIASENLLTAWGAQPEFGSSPEDDALEAMMHSIRYDSRGNGAMPGVQLDLDVHPGWKYKLQLIFSENDPSLSEPGGRSFDIQIEGDTIIDEFDSLAVTGPWFGSATGRGSVLTRELFGPADGQLNILLAAGSTLGNGDAILNAFTLEQVLPEPSSLGLLLLGGGLALLRLRRRRR